MITLDCNAPLHNSFSYETVSSALNGAHIVSINKTSDGRFHLVEGCDEHYEAYLTKDQFLAWIEELKQLADLK